CLSGVAGLTAGSGSLGLLIGVHLLAKFLAGLGKRLALGFDLLLVVALERFLGFGDGALDGRLLGLVELVAVVRDGLPNGVDQRVALVAGVDQIAGLLVLL